MSRKILSPKNDFIFKLLFGDKRNTDILRSFLQSVLDLNIDEYDTLEIVDPHIKKEASDGKLSILDVKLKTKNGISIDIEIQVINTLEMRERIVYYTSKMVGEQISEGMSYSKLKRVISIVITDFVFIKENDSYYNRYRLYDKNTKSEFSDIIEINTLEIPKLPKNSDNTIRWLWLKFLDVTREEELEVLAQTDPEIKKAIHVLERLSQDKDAMLEYEAREKAIKDHISHMESARREGRQEGRQEGIQIGTEKGRQEGIQIGEEKSKKEFVKRMLRANININQISEISGLSPEEIEKLRQE